jgi:pimeloyl-ACP methyl ester carboxylesterase
MNMPKLITITTESVLAAAAFVSLMLVSACARENATNLPKPARSGYAPVNGVKVYHAVYGKGKPLVILHGGLMHNETFGPNIAALAEGRQVIGVDLQGHGRTAPFDRPMTFGNMATDVAALIKWLGHEKADVLGYSMGGITALRLALDHPGVVDRLVLVSTPFAFSGWHDYNAQGMKGMAAATEATATQLRGTPLHQVYVAVAPNPADWGKTVAQTSALVAADYDWSRQVPGIKSPTLLVVGDWDAVRTAHTAAFFELLGGGKQDAQWDRSGMNRNRLAILPNLTHYEIGADPRLAETVIPFLDSK